MVSREAAIKSLEAFKARYDAKKEKELDYGEKILDSLNRGSKKPDQREIALAAFKARYEKANPEKAKKYQEILHPTGEKILEAHVNQFEELHKQHEKGNVGRQEIEAYAKKMEREPKMMEYLAHNHRQFHIEIREIVRAHERERERQLERSLERSRGGRSR